MEDCGIDFRETTRERATCVRIKSKRKEVQLLSKVVLRRLPPRLTKEALLAQLGPLPEYNYCYFVKPDWSLATHAYSRAYINFANPKDVFLFKSKFDGYLFGDDKDLRYAAVVEFSPFQRIPKKRVERKRDDKCATIESCDVYKQFVDVCMGIIDIQPVNEVAYWYHKSGGDKKITNTPLLEFIRQKLEKQKLKIHKREQRDRERKLRKDERKKTLRDAMSDLIAEN